MTHPALQTAFTKLVGVRLPIVQTGMGWVSGARLTAATSAAGGFGILASATMSLAELEAAIAKVKQRTQNPFGVNLRGDQPDLDAYLAVLERERIVLASFASPPPKAAIARLKERGILVMPTVGLPRHAEKMQAAGVDAVIAQGHEGGGHTGPVPTSLLVPQVVAAVDIPVIAAGGYFSGQGLVAALAYGAAGVAMGTRFLLTQESHVPDPVKQRYLGTDLRGTVVTEAVDGAPQRVVRTELIGTLESAGPLRRLWRALVNAIRFRNLSGKRFSEMIREGLGMRKTQGLTWAQVTMAANAPMLTKAALVDGRLDAGVLPTGQVVGAIDELPTVADVLAQIEAEADATLARLAGAGGAAGGENERDAAQ